MPTGTATARTHSCCCSMQRGRTVSFTPAAIAVAAVASNYGRCALVDSIAQALSTSQSTVGRVDRLSIQIGVARCHGHNEEMLRLTLERAELAPRTSSLRVSAAAAALYANHPKQALQLLNSIDPQTELSWSTDSSHFDYWSGETEALHLLGRHTEELSRANAMPSVAPLTRSWLRARALAALKRPAQLLAVIDTALTQQTETSTTWASHPSLPDGHRTQRHRRGSRCGSRASCRCTGIIDIPSSGRARARVVSRATGRRARDDGGASGCHMVARAHGIISRGGANGAYSR